MKPLYAIMRDNFIINPSVAGSPDMAVSRFLKLYGRSVGGTWLRAQAADYRLVKITASDDAEQPKG